MPSVSFTNGITDEWEQFHSELIDEDIACFSDEEIKEARKDLLNDIYEGVYEDA